MGLTGDPQPSPWRAGAGQQLCSAQKQLQWPRRLEVHPPDPWEGLHHQHLEPTKVSVDIFSLIPLPAMTSWNWKKASPTPRVNLSSPSWHHCWLLPKGITVSSQLLGCSFPALREVKRPLPRREIFTKIQ